MTKLWDFLSLVAAIGLGVFMGVFAGVSLVVLLLR